MSTSDPCDATSDIWAVIREKLREKGVDFEAGYAGRAGGPRVKVVCVAPDLMEAVEEMGRTARDQTVMVRLDEENVKALDSWVQTGYVKSRSEAAALFIREGLKLRASEFEQLKDALERVERARQDLRDKAREVFGDGKPAAE